MKTLAELAQEALQVQDACNLTALAHGFSRMMTHLHEALKAAELPTDTMAIRNNPIVRLWASKIHDLAGMGLSELTAYSEAHSECEKLANG